MEKILIVSAFFILVMVGLLNAKSQVDPSKFWKDGYCIQTTVETPAPAARVIRAKLDNKWQELPLVDFPPQYWKWNKERRMEYIEIFREMFSLGREASRKPQLSGPHNGMVATWGAARKDSRFKLNNAVKGMGFLPREDNIAGLIELLQSNMEATLPEKLDILDSLYVHAEEIFSHDKLVSLELYSEPGYNTQTFINQMVNPACVTVFLDIPTFKIKQISRLLHPKNPKLSPYEKQVISYINLIHSFFHGSFDKDFIAVIYYNIEIYDSSPGRDDAKGTKISK